MTSLKASKREIQVRYPVIYDMPGLRDSIKHGYNGLLVDSNPKAKTKV